MTNEELKQDAIRILKKIRKKTTLIRDALERGELYKLALEVDDLDSANAYLSHIVDDIGNPNVRDPLANDRSNSCISTD